MRRGLKCISGWRLTERSLGVRNAPMRRGLKSGIPIPRPVGRTGVRNAPMRRGLKYVDLAAVATQIGE